LEAAAQQGSTITIHAAAIAAATSWSLVLCRQWITIGYLAGAFSVPRRRRL
jgi:hypothetical protein